MTVYPVAARLIVAFLGAIMVDYQNDPQFLRLVAHSNDLCRRSLEAHQRSERASVKAADLFEYEKQLRQYVNALLIQTAPPPRQR